MKRGDKWFCRRGAVLQAILLHLLSSVIQPTLDAFEDLCTEGALPGAHEHLCVGFDGNVDARAPQFWQTACWRVQAHGQPVAPSLLAPVVEQVVAAGKSVALLRAHRGRSRVVAQVLDTTAAQDGLMSRCGPTLQGYARPPSHNLRLTQTSPYPPRGQPQATTGCTRVLKCASEAPNPSRSAERSQS